MEYGGLARKDVVLLDTSARTTFDEAAGVAKYLDTHEVTRLLLVTEGPHIAPFALDFPKSAGREAGRGYSNFRTDGGFRFFRLVAERSRVSICGFRVFQTSFLRPALRLAGVRNRCRPDRSRDLASMVLASAETKLYRTLLSGPVRDHADSDRDIMRVCGDCNLVSKGTPLCQR